MLKFHTDHFFHIGAAHLGNGTPCQDYAVSEVYNNAAIAIVSDGCSSGGQTDVGARILSLILKALVKEVYYLNDRPLGIGPSTCRGLMDLIHIELPDRLSEAVSNFQLNHNDMAATCLYAYLHSCGGYIFVQGDGAVAIKSGDNLRLFRFDWAENTPYYPYYKSFGLDQFSALHRLCGREFPFTEVQTSINLFGDCPTDAKKIGHSLESGIAGHTIWLSAHDLSVIDQIGVFSDGVCQIAGIDWIDAIRDLMSFKNVNGDFAKRRMMRFIRDSKKPGRGPIDDISYAVVRVERA